VEATEKEPVNKETEEMCVVLISNLPNKGYSIEEVYNLVKPFGALKDILILSSHKKVSVDNSCSYCLKHILKNTKFTKLKRKGLKAAPQNN